VFANHLAVAIDSIVGSQYTPKFSFNVAFGIPYCWIWDGTTLHAGSGGSGGVGGLFFSDMDIRRTALIKKYAETPSAQIVGFCHTPPVNSTFCTPDQKLNVLGVPAMTGLANRWFKQVVTADGNTWHPAIWSKNWVPGVFPITGIAVKPRLYYYKKRGNSPNAGSHIHDNQWIAPTPTPTPNG